MSIIIKDMEMPRSCGDCNLIMGCPVWRKKWIRYEDRLWYMENRDVCCPLKEVEDGKIH